VEAMKAYEEVELQDNSVLISVLGGGDSPASCSGSFTSSEIALSPCPLNRSLGWAHIGPTLLQEENFLSFQPKLKPGYASRSDSRFATLMP
jgi:hypothetical protein